MIYFANYEQDAVVREDENGNCFAKMWDVFDNKKNKLIPEYPLGQNSELRYGSLGCHGIPIEISKEEYDTFGITWVFGGEEWQSPFPKAII